MFISNKKSLSSKGSLSSSRFLPQKPRCPKQHLAKYVCVTQSCKYNPFLCDKPENSCQCHNAHKLCKSMQWQSVITLISNYRHHQTLQLQQYVAKIQQIYLTICQKANEQLQYFYQYLESTLYGKTYQNIKYYIQQEQFDKITSCDLGKIVNQLTKDIERDRCNDYDIKKFYQEDLKSLEKSTLNLLRDVEKIYIQKLIKKGESPNFDNKKPSKQRSQINFFKNISKQRTVISNESTNKNYNFDDNDLINPELLNQQIFKKMSESLSMNLKNTNKCQVQSNIFKRTSSTQFNTLMKKTISSYHMTPVKHPQNSTQINRQIRSQNKMIQKKSNIIEYPKKIPSKIIADATSLNILLNMGKIKQYKLLYRGSQSQFSIGEFYRKIAVRYKSQPFPKNLQTVLIFKTEHEKVVVGSTKLKWQYNYNQNMDQSQDQGNENSSKYKEDIRGSTYLYSLDLNEKYQLKQPRYSIYCGKSSIGFGRQDIRIFSNANKSAKNFIKFPSSFNNGRYLPVKKSSMDLSGSHNSYNFKLIEWQAFQIVLVNDKRSQSTQKLKNYAQ